MDDYPSSSFPSWPGNTCWQSWRPCSLVWRGRARLTLVQIHQLSDQDDIGQKKGWIMIIMIFLLLKLVKIIICSLDYHRHHNHLFWGDAPYDGYGHGHPHNDLHKNDHLVGSILEEMFRRLLAVACCYSSHHLLGLVIMMIIITMITNNDCNWLQW